MEHDDGPVSRFEAADARLDLIAIGGCRLFVRHRVGMDLSKLDFDAPTLVLAQLVPTGIQEQPMQPRLEPIDVAQCRKVPPASDERLLDGVLRTVGIAEDEASRGIQPADRGACEHGERVMIAPPRPLHEVPLHTSPSACARPIWSCRRIWRALVTKRSEIVQRVFPPLASK